MKKTIILLAILTMSASLGFAISNSQETNLVLEAKATDEPNIVGTFSIVQSYSTNPFSNNTRFLWLKVAGTDYPDTDGQGNYKISDSNLPEVCSVLYDSALSSFTLDDRGSTLSTSYHDIQLNMWQRHPFFAIGLSEFAAVRKVDISDDFLIPSYALYNGNTESKTYGFYKLDRNYTLTLSEEEAAKEGGGDSEQNWQLEIEAKSEKNSLNTVHIRSEIGSNSDEKLSMIFKFNKSNYSSQGRCTQFGSATFLDKVKIYTDNAKYALKDLVRDNYMTYKLWGEEHGFGIAISSVVNAYTAKYIEFEEGTTFPQLNGVDYYTFDAGTFKNANTNSAQLGWTTMFTPCNAVKLVTYNIEGESPITSCASVGSIVTLPARAGYKVEVVNSGDLEITNDSFTMPDKDVSISIKYVIKNPEAIPNSIDTIHIRSNVATEPLGMSDEDLFIVFKFTKSDYVNQLCTDIGDTTFLDKVYVYTDLTIFTLRELIRDNYMMFKLWGEENGFGIAIKSLVNAYTAKYFVFEEGVTFPTIGGYDYYTFEAGAFKNNNDNPKQVGWTTSFTPCANPKFITYKENGKIVSMSCEPTGSTIVLPSKRGYITNAVCDDVIVKDGSFTMPNKDIEIELSYSLENYTITYNLDGGVAENPETYTIETNTFTLVNPVKEGHTFIGWTNDEIEVPTMEVSIDKGSIGNKTFIANYSINSYTVTFDSDGGTQINPQSILYGELAIAPTEPTKEGLSFLGWFDGDLAFDFSTPIKGDLTLKAKWGRWITVTFDSNGGSLVSSLTFEAGKVLEEVVSPTRTGFRFDGWFLGETLFDATQPINDSITLVAHWTDLNPQSEEKKGCGGSLIAASAVITGLAITGTVLIASKKKED